MAPAVLYGTKKSLGLLLHFFLFYFDAELEENCSALHWVKTEYWVLIKLVDSP